MAKQAVQPAPPAVIMKLIEAGRLPKPGEGTVVTTTSLCGLPCVLFNASLALAVDSCLLRVLKFPLLIARVFPPSKQTTITSGPPPAQRKVSKFQSTLIAELENESGVAPVAVTVTGGEAGYEETAKMVVEAGLALILQNAECPGASAGGFQTPAACMGTTLIRRLHDAGIRFEVLGDAASTAAAAVATFYASAKAAKVSKL